MGIQEDFLEACRKGDADTVKKLINNNYHTKRFFRGMYQVIGREIDVNMAAVNGDTPLTLAAQGGHASIIQLLAPYLTSDSLNALNPQQFSALMLASKSGHIEAMNALICLPEIELHKTNRYHHDALILVASSNRGEYIDAVRALLAAPQGLNPNPSIPRVKTALMWAAERGYRQIVEALLAHPAIDIHRINRNNDTAITIAFENGHHDIVTLLEQHGAILPEHLRLEVNNHINGNQSVHEVSVHISVSRSAKNLAEQYALSPNQVAEHIKEISAWLENDFKDPTTLPREYNPIWLEPAKRCVERLSGLDFIDQRSGISMQQALAFVWAGINNRQAKGAQLALLEVEEIISRRIHFLRSLYEIQREYNLSGGANPIDNGEEDKSTCVSGSFNKLIAALSSVGHRGVEIVFVTKAYIAEQIGFLTKKAFGCLPREARAKFAEEWEGENQEKIQESCFSLLKTWVKDKLHELFDDFKEELPDLDNIIEESASAVSYTDMDEVMLQEKKKIQEETKEEQVETTHRLSLLLSKTLSFTPSHSKNGCFSENRSENRSLDNFFKI